MVTHLTMDQLRQLANDQASALAHLEAVLASLDGPDEERTNWACEILENCGAPPSEQIDRLSKLTAHSSPLLATWACKLLARMGAGARPAQDQLVAVLAHSHEPLVREEAARALGALGHLSAAAEAALDAAIREGGPRLKRLATAALRR